jgi:RNA methyltransferase, TrmH family
VITSAKNPRVAEALKLRKRGLREDRRSFLVEGPQAVGEALAEGPGLEVLFHTGGTGLHPIVGRARELRVATVQVSEELVRHLTSTVTPQGLVGVAPFVDRALDELAPNLGLVAVLCQVRDPGNAGAVLRSADAAGSDAVVFSSSSVDIYNAKTVRASAGSLFHLPVVRDVSIDEAVSALRERGMAILAAGVDGQRDLFGVDLRGPTAFLFGNEAWGLSDDVRGLADATVRIPLASRAESLNLASAAAVCLFEAVRQRRGEAVSLASMVSVAAHDIRSPLTALGGAASTLLKRWRDTTDAQREELFRAMGNDAARMNETLREVVDAARILEGKLELSPERVDLAALVRRIADESERNADHPPVKVDARSAPSSLVDEQRVGTALRAMVRAAGWWGREGPVHVALRPAEGTIRIDVARSAPELRDEDPEAVFAAGRPGAGAGVRVGLFVARGVAEAHGGSLTADVGPAIRLTLALPVR